MGTISITPDADGDLHDASLHNNKFQTILNEINGNLDANNLANPNSFLVLNSFAGSGFSPAPANPYFGWGTTFFAATPVLTRASRADTMVMFPQPSRAVSECNVILASQFQNTTGAQMDLFRGSFVYQSGTAFNSADVILYAQKNTSTVGDGWVDMATMTFDPNSGGFANVSISAFNTTPSLALPANAFFRVLIQNNAVTVLGTTAATLALQYASFTATFKVPHTS